MLLRSLQQFSRRTSGCHCVAAITSSIVGLPPRSAFTSQLHQSSSSSAASFSSTSSLPSLLPSQSLIVLPQLAPRMERGRVSRWLVNENDEIKPTQVILEIETNELTEDGTSYVLEVESHESGVVRKIIQPAAATDSIDSLPVGTPIGIFEDPDWQQGDPRRGDFLWQAYVKEGAVRQGSCAPTRDTTPADETKAAEKEKTRAKKDATSEDEPKKKTITYRRKKAE